MRKKTEFIMGAALGPDFISLFNPRNEKAGHLIIQKSSANGRMQYALSADQTRSRKQLNSASARA